MTQSKLPEDWTEERVRRILAHYEVQTEDEVFAEDEAGIASSQTAMKVPHDLVPKVRELIAKIGAGDSPILAEALRSYGCLSFVRPKPRP